MSRDLDDAELAKQASRFDQLFEQAPEAIVLLDADDRVLRINGEFTRLFGYRADEAVGRPLNELVVPDGVVDGATQTKVRSLRHTKGRVSFDVVRRHKNGSLLHVSVLGVPVDVTESDVHGLAIYRDVTDRIEAELARRRTEERYRSVVEAATDAVVTIDEGSTILFANPAVLKIFGYAPEDLIGKRLTTLMPERMRPHHEAGLHRYLHSGQRRMNWHSVELTGLRKSGDEFPIEVSFGEVIEDGRHTFTGFIRDITERKRAEEALKASERALRQIIETMPDLVWSAAPDGTVDHVNQRVLDYNGGSLDDLPNNGWVSVIHPDDVEVTVRAWMHAVTTGEPYAVEFRHRRFDGVYRWFSSRALPLRDAEGRIVRWFGLLSDIDDRKKAAEALVVARAELAHVARRTTMGEFAASVAHEVNQPLAAVVANANACRRWLARKAPDLDEAKTALQRIIRDGKRASDVIVGMRSFLQRSPREFAAVALIQVVREVLVLVGPDLTEHRVTLHRALAGDLPPVEGDRIQLQQVVLNLVMNAIQAMTGVAGRPRELTIALSRCELEGLPAQVVRVEDTGVGLDPSRAGKLFEAFYTTKPDGLGMGLAISRSIIEVHNGRLWATPNQPHGATFQFALPQA